MPPEVTPIMMTWTYCGVLPKFCTVATQVWVPPDAETLSVCVQVSSGILMVFEGMTTVMGAVREAEPLPPVTVIVYVPALACGPILPVSVTLLLPPAVTVTLLEEKLRLNPPGAEDAVRLTVPEKLPRLVTAMVEVNVNLPFWLLPTKKSGLAVTLKSTDCTSTVT